MTAAHSGSGRLVVQALECGQRVRSMPMRRAHSLVLVLPQKPAKSHILGPPVKRLNKGTLFSVVCFSRGTSQPQKVGQRALLGDLGIQFPY